MTQIQAETIDNMVNVTLPPILDISHAEALRDCLLDTIAPDMVLTLDSAQVEQMTTPGIQMMLAVVECASRKGMAFKLANPSEPLIDAFKDSGLFPQLMSWDLE
ncbi:MAG: STAS domain-containing protein [Geminicoccales bacterium]|jgi:anti-anti-sigma factor